MPHKSYRPDFYVVEDNMFYEVSGTRQAYSLGREKYEAFQREYPSLKFKIVNPDGTDYCNRKPLVKEVRQRHTTRNISLPLTKLINKKNKTHLQSLLVNFIIKHDLTIKTFSRQNNFHQSTISIYLRADNPEDPVWLKKLSLQL